jgi:hypothetical protein
VKNAIFWDVTPCGSCKNRRFGGTNGLHNHAERISELGKTLAVTRKLLLVTVNVVPSSLNDSTLRMKAIRPSRNNAPITVLETRRIHIVSFRKRPGRKLLFETKPLRSGKAFSPLRFHYKKILLHSLFVLMLGCDVDGRDMDA